MPELLAFSRCGKFARSFVAMFAVLLLCSGAMAVADDGRFPIRVSANGRYLEDASGQPFLLHGDTAWSLMVQLDKGETEEYLENRREKGFNAILTLLTTPYFAENAPRNRAGAEPFTRAGDFSTPNEVYFAHADWVIQKAKEKRMLVVLDPLHVNNYGDEKSWRAALFANEPAKCRDLGRYLGNRYKNFTNIVWQAVGDMTPSPGSFEERNWLEILHGIKEFAPDQMWTSHYRRNSTARDQAAFAPYMNIDNAYGGNRSYIQTLRAYNRTDPRPTFFNEAYYEDTGLGASRDVGKPRMLRAQAYWALLSGATGHIFGSDHIWPFGGPFSGPGGKQRWDWRAGMDLQGSREMALVKQLFDQHPWHELVPDLQHTVVTKGYGTFGEDDRTPGGDYVTAARTDDGSLVMAYVPSTGTEPRTITVDMAKLSGIAKAQWFNPTSGAYTTIGGSPFVNEGSRDFTTPGDNGTETNDSVLVLEANRKN